ncbi:LysR family transcriptional regulator [Paenibacillus pinihumi]|uniref:LysR family transcriptional regulator n=1 Tax=Paenibacillus pinihumi TaxID=669462 RepID=UPI00040EC41B|nr:LysR family transcriptional regulator [Paenibacillus pinihumi]
MEINLEWYRVFYWAARTGSLSSAAKHLHITQPAVSHTLKQLELKLGGPLFYRTGRGVELTAEGKVLYTYAEQALSFMDAGEKKIAEMQQLESGEIHIGASDSLCKHYLLPLMEQFHRQYPDVRIRVMNRTTPETISILKEGKLDFGLVHLPAADSRLEIRQGLALQDCLVGGERYKELAASPMPLSELGRYPLLLLEKGGSTRKFLDQYAASHQCQLEPEFELGSMDLLAEFAQSGFGLAFVTRNYIGQELVEGKLFELPLFPPVPRRHIGIATLRGVPLSVAAGKFLELLV